MNYFIVKAQVFQSWICHEVYAKKYIYPTECLSLFCFACESKKSKNAQILT